MASTNSTEPITETITESNIGEIVETLYNNDDELIGYACKQVLQRNTVEPMDVMFYFDMLTPKATSDASATTPQQEAIGVTQELLLREMSREFQIDPFQSRGVRCFDLPVDGSTWIVEMTIEKRDFVDIELFGGCREIDWDPETHDCKFYEAHMKGSYIGKYKTDNDGIPFSDAVTKIEELISGPLAGEIHSQLGGGILGPSNYQTAFLGVPIPSTNPNFQGGADQGRENLNEPTNIKTGVESSYSAQSNRKTITVVGGLLVACFAIAFALLGYVLYNRRRSYREDKELSEADLEEEGDMHYDIDTGGSRDIDDDESHSHDQAENHYDEPAHDPDDEYPNLPMSAEAIQMDLGNTLKGQMMGYRANTNSRLFSPERERGEDPDLDESDSWAQTDGTIGSLELQLEPITAEV